MNANEIIEGDRLIGKFIGYYQPTEVQDGLFSFEVYSSKAECKKDHPGCKISKYHNEDIEGFTFVDNPKYSTSWKYLMPVLEKICRTKVGDGIEFIDYAHPRTFGMINKDTGQIMVRLNGFILHEADTLIEAVYMAIIEFLKSYNENSYFKQTKQIK
jgi:hypothetical protein